MNNQKHPDVQLVGEHTLTKVLDNIGQVLYDDRVETVIEGQEYVAIPKFNYSIAMMSLAMVINQFEETPRV